MRMIRRERADVFSALAEGLKGKRAKEWGLIDDTFATSKFQESVDQRVAQIVGEGQQPSGFLNGQACMLPSQGIKLGPLEVKSGDDTREYKYVSVKLHRDG